MLTRVALGSVSLLGNSNGYSPSQSWHRNLRPPAFTSVHRMGLLHLRQRGGGGFLTTMMLTLDWAGAQNSQSPIEAKDGRRWKQPSTNVVSGARQIELETR